MLRLISNECGIQAYFAYIDQKIHAVLLWWQSVVCLVVAFYVLQSSSVGTMPTHFRPYYKGDCDGEPEDRLAGLNPKP